MEFIGPFALVFIGAGSIIMTGGENLVAIALAHGLAIAVMVAAAGHISGGLYNPALTVGLVVSKKMTVQRGGIFVVSELLGGLVAALALVVIYPSSQINAVDLGTPALGEGIGVGAAVFAELILTFFLMFVVFGVAIDPNSPKSIAPLAIGLTITADIFTMGAVTGAAMNPARAFGPALVQNFWADQWVYWVGPILGAAIAALLYNQFILSEEVAEETTASEGDVEQGAQLPGREE